MKADAASASAPSAELSSNASSSGASKAVKKSSQARPAKSEKNKKAVKTSQSGKAVKTAKPAKSGKATKSSAKSKAVSEQGVDSRDIWLKRAQQSEVFTGKASWYGRDFHGGATASGLNYDMYTFTAEMCIRDRLTPGSACCHLCGFRPKVRHFKRPLPGPLDFFASVPIFSYGQAACP